jgi:glycosyltransferase involved in cell wall biosynthesis
LAELDQLRILAFNEAFWPHVGGAETFLLQLATYLHQQGFAIAVATRTPHHGDNPLAFPVYWQPSERQLRELVDWCDVLHLNAMHVGLLLRAAWRWKKIVTTNHDVTMICPKGTKVRYDGPCNVRAGPVVCLHCLKRSGTPRPWRMLIRPPTKTLLSALVDVSVVISPWAMARYGLLHKRLIEQGTDLERFLPGSEGRRAEQSDRLPRVIFVGRVVYDKGVQLLVEALAQCRDAGTAFELLICGDGDFMPEIAAAVAARDLGPLVRLAGTLQSDALVAALQAADVAVVPSLCDEGFGLAAIEAMACGLPVIASDRGALGSIVAELGSDMVFEPGNAAQLAERLLPLLADPALRRAKGALARRLAQQRYDVRRMLQAYRELFASLGRASPDRRRSPAHLPGGNGCAGCA